MDNKLRILNELVKIKHILKNIDSKLKTLGESLELEDSEIPSEINESGENEPIIEREDIGRLFKKMNVIVDSKSRKSSG